MLNNEQQNMKQEAKEVRSLSDVSSFSNIQHTAEPSQSSEKSKGSVFLYETTNLQKIFMHRKKNLLLYVATK